MWIRMTYSAAIMVVALASAYGADRKPEVFTDWRDADIVVQQLIGEEGQRIEVLTGSRYSNAGLVRITGGGPYVIQASILGGVAEVPLKQFIAQGAGEDFSVFRVADLDVTDLQRTPAELAWNFVHQPYDHFFSNSGDRQYSSELIHRAFDLIGIDLGHYRPLGELDLSALEADPDWIAAHPACQDKALADCWTTVWSQSFISIESILRDPRVELVYSSRRCGR